MNTSQRRRALATTTTMTKESLYDGHNDEDAEPLRDDYDHEAEPYNLPTMSTTVTT